MTALATLITVIAVAVVFFDVTMRWNTAGYLLAVTGLGICSFFLLGVAVSTLVPTADTALPVAYGTMLPVAFISDVFFSSAHAPRWLHDLASAFPVAPIARAMESAFTPGTRPWSMPATGLLTVGAWTLGTVLLTALAFRWEPGSAALRPSRMIKRRTGSGERTADTSHRGGH